MEYYGTSHWAPTDSLYHHGIKGMKWGVRRYQNADGTLTAAGKKRYGSQANYDNAVAYKKAKKDYNKSYNAYYKKSHQAYSLNRKKRDANLERLNTALDDAHKLNVAERKYKTSKRLERSRRNSENIMSERAANEERLIAKNEKKIAKGKMTREQADAKLKDFRDGTRIIARGQARYDSIIKAHGDTRLKALNDPSYRKTEEYKKAGKEFAELAFLNATGGQNYAKLYYAVQEAISDLND